jgi:hypothetical protein
MERDGGRCGVEIDHDALAAPYAGCDSIASVTSRAARILAEDVDAAAAASGSTANFIVDYLDAAQMVLWDVFASRTLSPSEEKLYRSSYETAMLSYAAPSPLSTAQKVLALLESGRLRIIKGVADVSPIRGNGAFRIDHEFGTEYAEHLVNATGSVDRDVNSLRQSALVRSESARSIYVANMFLWGPGLYVSSAIMMATVVGRMLRAVFESSSD